MNKNVAIGIIHTEREDPMFSMIKGFQELIFSQSVSSGEMSLAWLPPLQTFHTEKCFKSSSLI